MFVVEHRFVSTISPGFVFVLKVSIFLFTNFCIVKYGLTFDKKKVSYLKYASRKNKNILILIE